MLWTDYPPLSGLLREAVRGAIEEAAAISLPVADPLPDELLAAADIERIPLGLLQVWIYRDDKADGWSAAAFARWARAAEMRAREIGLRAIAMSAGSGV